MRYLGQKCLSYQNTRKCNYKKVCITMTLSFDLITPKCISVFLSFFILYLWMNYKTSQLKTVSVFTSQLGVKIYIAMTLISIGVFLSYPLPVYKVWSLPIEKFWSYGVSTKMWTDGRIDRQTYRHTKTDKVITIGPLRLRWQGHNYQNPTW